jgi:hypothetical protein
MISWLRAWAVVIAVSFTVNLVLATLEGPLR